MPSRKDCIDEILAAAGGRKTRAEAEAEMEGIDARAREYQDRGYDKAKAYQKAADDALRREAERAALARRQERENAAKFIVEQGRIGSDLRRGISPRLSLEAMTTGVNVPSYKSRNSIESMWQTYRYKWTGNAGVMGALERSGLDKVYIGGGKKLDYDVARELGQLEKGDAGAPGYTKNAQALEIAKIFHAFDNQAMADHNLVGGWISSMQQHVIKVSHSPDAIRFAAAGGNERPLVRYDLNPRAPKGGLDADRAAWIADVMKWFDMKRTFGPLDPRDVLPQMWASFSDGDHFDYAQPSDSPIYANVAQKAAAHRELIPNDVDSLLAYNEKYGLHRSFREAKFAAYDALARQTALVGRLGTRPQEALDGLINYAKQTVKGTPAFKELVDFEHKLRAQMAQLDGSANRPVNRLGQRIIRNAMVWESMSMLGRVALTHIEGLASKASYLRYAGVGLGERYGAILRGFTRGGEGSEKRELNELLWTNADAARTNLLVGSYSAADGVAGVMPKTVNLFFKLSLVGKLLENQMNETEQTLARQVGMWRGKDWAGVGERERRVLRNIGIEEPEWKALNTVDWTAGRAMDGQGSYLTPTDVMKLSDQAVESYLRERPQYGQFTYQQPEPGAPPDRVISPARIEKARHDLAMNVAMLYGEAGRASVFSPSIRARAAVFGDLKPGSWRYEMWRMMMQFKMWPLEMFYRQWGRMIYGGDTGMDKIAGIVEFVVGSTVLGVLGESLRDTAKGQNPLAEMEHDPLKYVLRGFLRSGAGTIMGDYLLGEYNTHGANALASLAGPIFGQIPNLLDLFHGGGPREQHPWQHRAADGIQFLKSNTPFVNLWFTDWAFQYLVIHNLQEWLNPGYVARTEQRLKDQRGTQFLLSPTKVNRIGLVPAIAEATGER